MSVRSFLRNLDPMILLALMIVTGQPGEGRTADRGLCFRGINLSGAEYGDRDGKEGINYTYPSAKTARYFADRGFDAVRLPFKWERLQPILGQGLDGAELERLRNAVGNLRGRGFSVILDPHNFGYYGGDKIGSDKVSVRLFANFWTRLAVEFANQDGLVFGLMNEPHDIGSRKWLEAANAALLGIRAAKARNLVLVPGTHWSGASSWEQDFGEGSNANVMLGIKDPLNNYAFEVHQYFDSDFSGTHAQCVNAAGAEQAINRFTEWLKAHGQRGFLGEFGVSAEPGCLDPLGRVIKQIGSNPDVWLGWTYWAAGDWWPPTEALNIQPTTDGDRPQFVKLLEAMGPRSKTAGSCALN